MSALQALVPGGIAVYSTCSMSPLENDGVVDEVLLKCSENSHLKIEVVNLQFTDHALAEMFNYKTTKNGVLVLPSKTKNWGPIYFCKLRRVLESEYDLQYKV